MNNSEIIGAEIDSVEHMMYLSKRYYMEISKVLSLYRLYKIITGMNSVVGFEVNVLQWLFLFTGCDVICGLTEMAKCILRYSARPGSKLYSRDTGLGLNACSPKGDSFLVPAIIT